MVNLRPIRIAIDLTGLQPTVTGVDVYMMELVRHLDGVDDVNRYTLLTNLGDGHRFNGSLKRDVSIMPWCLPSRPMRFAMQQVALPLASLAGLFDVIHSPSFLMPLWKARSRHLLTVHDMTMFSMPDLHNRLRRSPALLRGIAASIRRADLVNVPSQSTRNDLLSRFPEIPAARVRVTPLGVDPRFCLAPQTDTARHIARLGIPRPYVLYVGTIEPRKNLISLLESFEQLITTADTDIHLVLAGQSGWNSSEVFRKMRSPRLLGRVHCTGYVASEDLPWLYRGARIFVYPSLFEGFGFPPLEAASCGIPVITSYGSSLEENLHDAAEFVAPEDIAALSAAMWRLLCDADRRERLIAAGLRRAAAFRWEKTARHVLNCYRDLAAARL